MLRNAGMGICKIAKKKLKNPGEDYASLFIEFFPSQFYNPSLLLF